MHSAHDHLFILRTDWTNASCLTDDSYLFRQQEYEDVFFFN